MGQFSEEQRMTYFTLTHNIRLLFQDMEGSGKNDMLIGAGARGPQVSVRVCQSVFLYKLYVNSFKYGKCFLICFFQGPTGLPGPQGPKVIYV